MTSNDSSNRLPMDRDGSNIGKKSNSPAKRSRRSTIFMRMWLSTIMGTTTIRQRKSWKAKMRSFEPIGRLLEERKSTTRCRSLSMQRETVCNFSIRLRKISKSMKRMSSSPCGRIRTLRSTECIFPSITGKIRND